MADAPDFRLYHSNSLEVLAGLLANQLRERAPAQSLLAPDVVLIPQAAMRRWLQATLAQAHGIAANLEFLTPGEFVRRALDANVAGAGEDLDADALRWQLYAALRDPASRSWRDYLDGDDPLRPWSLAGELATVFEKYQAWRRDWLLDWEAKPAADDAQAQLWRAVARGRQHRARRIDAYLHGFADDGAPSPDGLPSRLFVFATLNVSPDVLRVIASQARVGSLHFYLPSPTRAYWGDLQTLRERLATGGEAAAFDVGENLLLQAWGAAGRDFMAVLGGYEVVHPSSEHEHYVDPEQLARDDPGADSLLGRLQRELLHRRAPVQPWREDVDRGDCSLQVHACHTRLREVQVLHDQLRGLLEDARFDPPLQPREIAVLAPDIDPYIPHIEAVFGGRAGHGDFIPYALADASALAGEPLAEVFNRLLALPVSRFGLGETLDLLGCAALAEAAGLDAPALQRLRDWLRAAGARWGVDAAHRARHDAPEDAAYTWRFALDRLLLGHAIGDDDLLALPSGEVIAPWPDLEGSAVDALDALLRVLRVLERNERTLAESMSPAQWRDRLLGLLDALLPDAPTDPAAARALTRLRQLVDGFAEAATQAGFDAPVPAEVVRAHFAAVLAEADTRAPLLTGGVSFGRMVPMRLLPFRAICVLGMNDDDYPRRDPAAGLNRLAAELHTAQRRRGDRSLREDDRFLFLQLFAAAGEVFYLSFIGADPRDGSAREPSLLVAELLDAAAAQHADAGGACQALVVHHPLQPFAPAAFGDGDARRFSYRDEWQRAAGHGGERTPLAAWVDAPLSPPDIDTDILAIAELRRFLRDPSDAFLRQRLGVRLPESVEAADDCEPLAPPSSGLLRWQMQRAVFDACLSGQHDDPARLHACLRAQAMLPSGALGERQLRDLLERVQPYADKFAQWRGDAQPQSLTIDLSLDGIRLQGHIDDVYAHGLPRWRFDTLHGPAQIDHGLDWLLLAATDQARELMQFCDTGNGADGVPRAAADPTAARDALSALLRLRNWGLRDPLPFAPRAGWLWYDGEQQLAAGYRPRANSKTPWQRAHDQWSPDKGFAEGGTDAARLALRGRDPFNAPALGEQFRDIARLVFDAVTLGRDREAT